MSRENFARNHFGNAWTEIKKGTQDTIGRATEGIARVLNTALGLPVPVVYREISSNDLDEPYTTFILPGAATRRQKILAAIFNVIEEPDEDYPETPPLRGIEWLNAQPGVIDAFIEHNGNRLVVYGELPDGHETAVTHEAKVAAPFLGNLALIKDTVA